MYQEVNQEQGLCRKSESGSVVARFQTQNLCGQQKPGFCFYRMQLTKRMLIHKGESFSWSDTVISFEVKGLNILRHCSEISNI